MDKLFKTNLPIYRLVISENMDSDIEVDYVALVDKPAIEKSFLAFRDAERIGFEIQSEDQKIITGPLMLAYTPIYRSDANGEYYVMFDQETVKQIALKFFKKGYQSNVNLMHDSGRTLTGLTMFESWIKDTQRGVQAMKGFEHVPDGSWFGSFKVENNEVWDMIKSGQVKGFSVEGIFNYVPLKMEEQKPDKDEELMKDVINILNSIN